MGNNSEKQCTCGHTRSDHRVIGGRAICNVSPCGCMDFEALSSKEQFGTPTLEQLGRENEALRSNWRQEQKEVERLQAQLPDGMKDCTIRFIECEKGHGRLTATNWVDNGCHWCEIERLTRLLNARPPYYCQNCDCASCGNTRRRPGETPAYQPTEEDLEDPRIVGYERASEETAASEMERYRTALVRAMERLRRNEVKAAIQGIGDVLGLLAHERQQFTGSSEETSGDAGLRGALEANARLHEKIASLETAVKRLADDNIDLTAERDGLRDKAAAHEMSEAEAWRKYRELKAEMRQDETEPPTFAHVGKIAGWDESSEHVLVEWRDDTAYDSREGTLLFVRLWTQAEIDEAHKRGEELYRGLVQTTSPEETPDEQPMLKGPGGQLIGGHVPPEETAPPPLPERMRITYERYGRCLWHEDCDKSRSGIMREVSREESRSLLECLHCGRQGYFPVGGTSVCVPVESVRPVKASDDRKDWECGCGTYNHSGQRCRNCGCARPSLVNEKG